jgi:HAMP domain-containing protein
VFWSNIEFTTAVHELGHISAAINFKATPVAVTIHARGGLAEWRWLERAPSPKMLIIIAAAGYLAERELLGRHEPLHDSSDEDQIAKLGADFTGPEIDRCCSTAGAIVRMRRQWILSTARGMLDHRKYLFNNDGDLRHNKD